MLTANKSEQIEMERLAVSYQKARSVSDLKIIEQLFLQGPAIPVAQMIDASNGAYGIVLHDGAICWFLEGQFWQWSAI